MGARDGSGTARATRAWCQPARRCLNRGMARVLGPLGSFAAASVLVGTALVTQAQAIPGPGPVVGAGDVDAHPGAVRARVTFTKRPAHPWDSRLAWDAWKQ